MKFVGNERRTLVPEPGRVRRQWLSDTFEYPIDRRESMCCLIYDMMHDVCLSADDAVRLARASAIAANGVLWSQLDVVVEKSCSSI